MSDPTQKVVVYRSQMEQVQDEFWMAHPEVALGLVAFVVFFFLIVWAKIAIDSWSFRKKWNEMTKGLPDFMRRPR